MTEVIVQEAKRSKAFSQAARHSINTHEITCIFHATIRKGRHTDCTWHWVSGWPMGARGTSAKHHPCTGIIQVSRAFPVLGILLPSEEQVPYPATLPPCSVNFKCPSLTLYPAILCHLGVTPVSWVSKNMSTHKFKICFLVVTVNPEEKKINPFIPLRPQVHFRKYIFR